MEVVNPKGVYLNRNAIAKAFVKNDVNALRFFDFADEIKIEHPVHESLNFTPILYSTWKGISLFTFNQSSAVSCQHLAQPSLDAGDCSFAACRVFKHFPRFGFFMLPNRINTRPAAANLHKIAQKG
jgi:hypothetical protein